MIKIDIPMPKLCSDCVCNYDGIECNVADRVFTEEERNHYFDEEYRPEWCPLIEVKDDN